MRKIITIASPTMLLLVLLVSYVSARQQPTTFQKPQSAQVVSSENFNSPDEEYKQRLIDSINTYFAKAIQEKLIVGAAIGIVKCDSVVYIGGYGKRNVALQDKINEETIFRIGSVSKGFAGILAGIHVEEGLLDWDDKIVEYVPDFRFSNLGQTKKISLSHILSHTTGLPYHSYTNLVEDGVPIKTIANQFKKVTPIDKPGKIYSYQNAVFALSGTIIEEVTGMPFKQVIRDKIFEPLQMTSASASYEAIKESENVAEPHRRRNKRWNSIEINKKYYNNAIAAGGINASVSDMAKWMKFLLGNNPEVMMPDTMDYVFNPKIEVTGRRQYYQKWPGYAASFYGLGWRIHTLTDKELEKPNMVFHHGGSVNDYRSEIAIYPEEDLGICVLFNSQTSLARDCIPVLYKIIKEVKLSIRKEYIKKSVVSL
ncbi:serine hydrolase [Aquimarina sp. I32.4]|uniref:serine hydrolase domain-containing protein n=1 Tax=Aquimarina sp. I32.4 TaxID=2053903 RepID=UPI000CDF1240|nr:serine hydrolase domain-containing protein [Aquimarina sp. I32.4]